MDEKLKPYAQFLEGFAKNLVDYQPDKFCVCVLLPDGEILTGYFGHMNTQDKALAAHTINCDAVLDSVMANAKMIVQAAEDQED